MSAADIAAAAAAGRAWAAATPPLSDAAIEAAARLLAPMPVPRPEPHRAA